MNTIEQIEKRRRELRRINYFLIYLLAMTIFGMFFFIDQVSGLFGALRYNIFLRFYFIAFIVAFLLYLAQKERQHARLTAQLIHEMQGTSEKLAKELRHKQFLSEISVLLANLGDTAVLEQLFSAAFTFFEADGGVVVLRDKNKVWKKPLVSFPEEIDPKIVEHMINLIGSNGRAFIQPDPEFPKRHAIKEVDEAFGAPLRLEGRLFGMIAFWSNKGAAYDRSDLAILEFISREATKSKFTISLAQEKTDQFNGLLELIAKAADEKEHLKDRTVKTARLAKSLARQLGLGQETAADIKIAAMLKEVDKIVEIKPGKSKSAGQSAKILESFGFPKHITEILAEAEAKNKKNKTASISSQLLRTAGAYTILATPARGRAPSPSSIMKKLEASGLHDQKILNALKETVLPQHS